MVAVVGATGLVGQEMIKVLEERRFPVSRLVPVASKRSAGKKVRFRRKAWKVFPISLDVFKNVDIALFSAGAEISRKFVPEIAAKGTIVIDNTSAFRMEPGIPLVVPEVNGDRIQPHERIYANPNCSTAQLVLVLKPIHDAARIRRVVVSTYQSVSGAGREAVEELMKNTKAALAGKKFKPKEFTYPIAFNVIPHIDAFLPSGYTKEEMKMINETRKILGDRHIQVTATTVRVPVLIGHSESVNIETEKRITPADVRKLLSSMPTVKIVDEPSKNKYPTPLMAAGSDDTFVGRIRQDVSKPNGIELWIVSDNLRRGAATNAVLIAERVLLVHTPGY